MIAVICVLIGATSIYARPEFRGLIPNGYNVPNPCGAGIWEAVGHFDPYSHTHEKNDFGQAFLGAGLQWTTALCQLDSDGDGRTNGQELGDPSCTWTVGADPEQAASGHPGICDPVGTCNQPFYCGCHGHNCVGK